MKPYYDDGRGIVIYHGDCLDVLPTLPDNSVDLIATDPPYYRVKGEAWDRQWKTAPEFLGWLDGVLAEFGRVLKPNGSLYLFASPEMAARVECLIALRFEVLNQVIWPKSDEPTHAIKYGDDRFRQYVQKSERIIFAQHPNPIGRRIRQAREAAGLRGTQIDVALGYVRSKDPARGTELCRRWEEGTSVPSREDFDRALRACGVDPGDEYDRLYRPFSVNADVPFTDVWDRFAAVKAYPGKHPCEKPIPLMEHIIRTSSRPGAVVLDAFCGSGATGEAARNLGRRFIGIDAEERWAQRSADRAARRLSQEVLAL